MFLEVRDYRAKDKAAVIRLDKLALSEIKAPGLPNHFDDLKDIEGNYLSKGSFVVAEIDGEIVGMGAITYSNPQVARIKRMRVHPNQQRQGIARSILNWLELRAEENHVERIVLDTLKAQHKAQSLYESNGYAKTGEGNPNGFHIVMYEKEIHTSGNTESEA